MGWFDTLATLMAKIRARMYVTGRICYKSQTLTQDNFAIFLEDAMESSPDTFEVRKAFLPANTARGRSSVEGLTVSPSPST